MIRKAALFTRKPGESSNSIRIIFSTHELISCHSNYLLTFSILGNIRRPVDLLQDW
ncbi:hypothetical protein JCM31598_03340 [Desulfonatronum parangueonense]